MNSRLTMGAGAGRHERWAGDRRLRFLELQLQLELAVEPLRPVDAGEPDPDPIEHPDDADAAAGRRRARRRPAPTDPPVPGCTRPLAPAARHDRQVERAVRRRHRHLHARHAARGVRAEREVSARSSTPRRALYIAKTPTSPAKGPFLAPADPMTVPPQYRSKQNTGPGRDPGDLRRPTCRSRTRAPTRSWRSRRRAAGSDRRARRGRGRGVLADPGRRPAAAGDRHRHARPPRTGACRC